MFDDLIKSMDADLIAIFGIDATWSRVGSVTVRCIIDKDVVRANDYGEVTRNAFELTMQRPAGTQPAVGDTFTTTDSVYRVDRIEADDGFIIKMAVSKSS